MILTNGFIDFLLKNWFRTKLMINFAGTNFFNMERIKLHDKYFKIYIEHQEILDKIKIVANQINSNYSSDDVPLFLAVLNGSFMFAADLMKEIGIPCEISFIKLSSYSGTESTGEVKEIIGLNSSVEGRKVIVVEDIVDTGNTITDLHKLLVEAKAADIKICTLLLKPNAYKKSLKIDYAAIQIPNDFIVGYGLDYDEHGRQLKDIYVLDKDNNK